MTRLGGHSILGLADTPTSSKSDQGIIPAPTTSMPYRQYRSSATLLRGVIVTFRRQNYSQSRSILALHLISTAVPATKSLRIALCTIAHPHRTGQVHMDDKPRKEGNSTAHLQLPWQWHQSTLHALNHHQESMHVHDSHILPVERMSYRYRLRKKLLRARSPARYDSASTYCSSLPKLSCLVTFRALPSLTEG